MFWCINNDPSPAFEVIFIHARSNGVTTQFANKCTTTRFSMWSLTGELFLWAYV